MGFKIWGTGYNRSGQFATTIQLRPNLRRSHLAEFPPSIWVLSMGVDVIVRLCPDAAASVGRPCPAEACVGGWGGRSTPRRRGGWPWPQGNRQGLEGLALGDLGGKSLNGLTRHPATFPPSTMSPRSTAPVWDRAPGPSVRLGRTVARRLQFPEDCPTAPSPPDQGAARRERPAPPPVHGQQPAAAETSRRDQGDVGGFRLVSIDHGGQPRRCQAATEPGRVRG